ncbi:RING-H2 finger protein ATL16-like [Telopea speciosissima]|uniref:RING-H2 finger protein ATL16-like n=1 Tax=Telopea speciosissima TaxID=54955 RepID=UPI001CC6CBD8|nr:RING-H2 finger protein ATL16-like [Telopea speciosissima]
MRGFMKYFYWHEGRLLPFSRLPMVLKAKSHLLRIVILRREVYALRRRSDRILTRFQERRRMREMRELAASSSSFSFGSQLQPSVDNNNIIDGNDEDEEEEDDVEDNEDDDNNGKKECVICLRVLKDEVKIRKLLCHHRFHIACITQWLKQRSTCPICRRSIFLGISFSAP